MARNGGGVYKGSGEGGPIQGMPVGVNIGAGVPGQTGLKGGTGVGSGKGAAPSDAQLSSAAKAGLEKAKSPGATGGAGRSSGSPA